MTPAAAEYRRLSLQLLTAQELGELSEHDAEDLLRRLDVLWEGLNAEEREAEDRFSEAWNARDPGRTQR